MMEKMINPDSTICWKVGKYEGKVTVQFLDTNLNPTTKLILPVKEKLFITIF